MNPRVSLPPAPLTQVLQAVAAGQMTVEQASQQLQAPDTVAIDNATIDLDRARRCRFGEVIYGEGKSAELITNIAKVQLSYGQNVLVTRLNSADAELVAAQFSYSFYHPLARTLRLGNQPVQDPQQPHEPALARPVVAVVTAGSTDAPVAEEVLQTLAWMNIVTDPITDVGVAGPQRLLAVVPRLRQATVVVVVAGMEAALASAVGGHVACPVIGVPTSVGYGSTFGGITAMLGMLSSCASNVSVVGIDAGFKAGYVAGVIVTQLEDKIRSLTGTGPR